MGYPSQPDFNLRREPDGRYSVRVYLGRNVGTGSPLQKYHKCRARTHDSALAEVREWWANELGNPLLVDALDEFIRDKERLGQTQPATVRAYRTRAAWMGRYLSKVHVRDLTARNVQDMYADMLEHGSVTGSPLSPNTIHLVHALLKGAYKWMVTRGYVTSNPMDSVVPPPMRREPARPLEDAEAASLRDWIRKTLAAEVEGDAGLRARCHALGIYLGLYCGLRTAEACGIRRRDVSMRTGQLSVKGQVRNDDGRGFVWVGVTKGKKPRNLAMTDEDRETLKSYMEWQAKAYPVTPDTTLVSYDGTPLNPDALSSAFRLVAIQLGFSAEARFHSLRHTQATYVLQEGIEAQTVSKRLGHADVSTTMNIYAHVMPGRDEAAARAFGAAMKSL